MKKELEELAIRLAMATGTPGTQERIEAAQAAFKQVVEIECTEINVWIANLQSQCERARMAGTTEPEKDRLADMLSASVDFGQQIVAGLRALVEEN